MAIEEDETEFEGPVADEYIAAQITSYLEIYPIISPTMLQAALGPSVKPAVWKPVLDIMISNGLVLRETVTGKTAAGRIRNFLRLSLIK